VPASRPPWWLFALSLSFLTFFIFAMYCRFSEPESEGFVYTSQRGRMVLVNVTDNSPAAAAGLEPGDHIVSVNGQILRSISDWIGFRATLALNRPLRIGTERLGEKRETTMTLRKHAWTNAPMPVRIQLVVWSILQFITLGMAIAIAYNKPGDAIALLGAWMLATAATFDFVTPKGRVTVWQQVPTPASLLLWIPYLSPYVAGAMLCTFFANFPRKFVRLRWLVVLVWAPALFGIPELILTTYRVIYRPEDIVGRSVWVPRFSLIFLGTTLAGGVIILLLQYFNLKDINERRRLQLLVLGTMMAFIPLAPRFFLRSASGIYSGETPFFLSASVQITSVILFLGFPLSFAYTILHHRLFDIRLVIRQGFQYALARRVLVSLVPVLIILLVVDLVLHGDQPLAAILRGRGWIYGALVGLTALAHSRRTTWLDALDRRFFREHYDAQRLMREVVEEVHAARSFEQESPRAVTRIEAALHPEFVALMVCEPRELSYRTLAVAPAGKGPPSLNKESKLLSLMRLLGKPLEVPQTESGWLQQQLPHEETEFVRKARVDLLIPIAGKPQGTEALLVMGVKRSEEPYSSEDQNLLVAVATSLAILLDRSPGNHGLRSDIFEECPRCGSCYDSGFGHCSREGERLLPVVLPRLLAERYRLNRRIGRGGMGTVYEALDTSLERRVAVKVIREDFLGSQEAAERFRGEARASASFAHPNVVTVHDFGVAAGMRAFLVMEILEGVTLREKLQRQDRIAPEQMMSITRGICDALTSAHRRHLVHRDLKPENIFLVNADAGQLAKLLDFGLAKFLSNSTQVQTVDTAAGHLVGTLRYMSPEQRRGGDPHPTWDLWALAVVAYEMLTGAYPFHETPPSDWLTSGQAVSFTPVTRFIAQNTGDLQDLFDRSFARELTSRHQSADAFFSDLRRASNVA
jgi:tRNA A-37 threonylcarbamoyl transferase component Bud32